MEQRGFIWTKVRQKNLQEWALLLTEVTSSFPSFPRRLSASRAPSRCHAWPSSLGLEPPWPSAEPSGGLITAAGASEDRGLMFSSWITSHCLALVGVCWGGERHSSRAVRPSVTATGSRERLRSLSFLHTLQLHTVLSWWKLGLRGKKMIIERSLTRKTDVRKLQENSEVQFNVWVFTFLLLIKEKVQFETFINNALLQDIQRWKKVFIHPF